MYETVFLKSLEYVVTSVYEMKLMTGEKSLLILYVFAPLKETSKDC